MMNINLDEWEWLREITALDTEAVNHYKELAHKNEVLMVKVLNKDTFNIYVPVRESR